MERSRPLGISYIGYNYIAGAIVLLISLNTEQVVPFNMRFGVPGIPEIIVRVFIMVFSLIMAYGYLKQTKWGYWTMMIYSALFFSISLIQMTRYNIQPYIVNTFYSLGAFIYTFKKRDRFYTLKEE